MSEAAHRLMQRSVWGRTAAVLSNRKASTMLLFGFAAGLPNVLVTGTLIAWFADAQVDVTTIGVLSWIGLAYAFKFLWSPALNSPLPALGRMLGLRRGWIAACQAVIALCILLIATTDPETSLGLVALIAAVAAFASATQDIAIDVWRIEVADESAPIDALSAIYQFGYRSASFVGGALALILADWTSWPFTYGVAAIVMALTILGTLAGPEPDPRSRAADAGHPAPRTAAPRVRLIAVGLVLAAWAWAALSLISFMVATVASDPAPNAAAFTATYGPLIIVATVLLPCLFAALIARGRSLPNADVPLVGPRVQGIADRFYAAIVEPLVELMSRLGWASLLVLALILTYRITDSIWGPFAYPFYMTELGHTKTEIGLASKTIGAVMTILGVGLGAVSLVWLGRMPSLLIGAIVAAATNLLFADLARGGVTIDAFLNATGLSSGLAWLGVSAPMARLITAIAGENIAVGFAGAAYVAYLSSLASRMYGAVQFAVFTSLTLLVGTLGRAALGDAIKEYGYGPVFEITAALGLIAVALCALEWYRQSRLPEEKAAAGASPPP